MVVNRPSVECPVCKKRVELTDEEEHDGYKTRLYSCGHISRHVQRSINETSIEVKEEVGFPEWAKTSDPIGAITRAKESRNYYEALSLACTFFGDYGKEILLWDAKETGNQISKSQLKNMDLCDITRELYKRNLINDTTRDKMNDVRQLRNDFQHGGLAFKLTSSQAQEAENMVTKAIDCIRTLKTDYESKIK
jgi:hypothetical protein